jgi:ABC-2 type transport system ATP-binding protein
VFFDGDKAITDKIVTASVQQGWKLQEIHLEKGLLDDIFKQLSNQSPN